MQHPTVDVGERRSQPSLVPAVSLMGGTARRLLNQSATHRILVAFLVLLLVQTPLAIIAYQYLNLPPAVARALLLVKDVVAAGLLIGLAAGYLAQVRMRWFDWAGLAYVATVLLYALVPLLLGTDLPLVAVAASVRQFLLPVELYAIGRLAVAAGVDPFAVLRTFVIASLVAAIATVGLYLLVPVRFWSTTLDLVSFEREVQGLPRAISLWDIGLLGQFGVSDTGSFARAVGPFTHPVGTANYFAVPLLLAATAALAGVRRFLPPWAMVAAVAIFAAAVITPISRGAWIAVGVAVVLVAFLYRRPLPALIGLGLAAAVIVFVPPFSYSIASALSGTDSSVIGHQEAVEEGMGTAIDNPFGMGLGQGDHFGEALSTEGGASGESASAGVGENLYLAMFVSVGPLGLAFFLAWAIGMGLSLWPGRRADRDAWARVAVGAILAGFLIASVSASPLLRFTTAGSFWLICGLVVPNVARALRNRPRGLTDPAHTPPHG